MGFGRTLIVEDDPAIRQSLADVCRLFLQIEPEQAGTAREAVALVERHRPAVLLLDLVLPDESGEWVIAQIRERGWSDDVRIIVMSAQNEMQDKAHAVGAWDSLEKPFSLQVVTEKLRNAGAM